MKIHGIDVDLIQKIKTGEDPFGGPGDVYKRQPLQALMILSILKIFTLKRLSIP